MFDMLVWRNKRSLLLILLVAALIFLLLFALLYPKTVFTLVMDHGDGSRVIYRMNSRGTVQILDYAGPSHRDGTVRLPGEIAAQAKALAQEALKVVSVDSVSSSGDSVFMLTVGRAELAEGKLPYQAWALWVLLEPYMP